MSRGPALKPTVPYDVPLLQPNDANILIHLARYRDNKDGQESLRMLSDTGKTIGDIIINPDTHKQTDIAALLTACELQKVYGDEALIRHMQARAIQNQQTERANFIGDHRKSSRKMAHAPA